MKSKSKWSSIAVVVILLVSYTHCDLMLTPQNGKVNYKNKNNSASTTGVSNSQNEISSPSTDYSNAFSYYEEIVKPKLSR